MVETLCDSGAVKLKAGANVSTAVTSIPATMTQFINQAEGDIAVDTGIDWVTLYSGISANFKQALEGACSNKAAIYAISYDMSGFTSRQEALNMLNVLWGSYDRATDRLREDKVKVLLGAT